MNHKVFGMLMVVLAVIACTPQVWSSMITDVSDTEFTIPYAGDPYDITAVGNLDWVVCMYSEKDATSVISTDGATALDHFGGWAWSAGSGYPTFSWTGGISSAPTGTGLPSGIEYSYNGTNVSTDIAVPAGSGQITVWWAYAVAPGPPVITATFADTTTASSISQNGAWMTVFDYSTDTAQTLTLSGNEYAGIFAVAVSQIPEPSTLLLLVSGLVGMAACAWRIQKKS